LRCARRAGIIETDLGTELILLDPGTQQMFSLNPTGRLIWSLLGSAPLDAIEQARARADALTLLEQLTVAGLVES
jgi:hypothetical protein